MGCTQCVIRAGVLRHIIRATSQIIFETILSFCFSPMALAKTSRPVSGMALKFTFVTEIVMNIV